ncbi:MAG: hypothetical protein WC052_01975 [Patescibacteria group bacterium]|jgi:hypothetical protein
MQIIWGLIITTIGALIVVYTEKILTFAGSMGWAEQWLRFYGGSRLGYKLVGVAAIIIGLLMVTGLIGNVLLGLFGGLFAGFTTLP